MFEHHDLAIGGQQWSEAANQALAFFRFDVMKYVGQHDEVIVSVEIVHSRAEGSLISQDLVDPLHTILRNVKTIYPHLAKMILEVTRKKTHTAAIVK
jgi:uncharacterized UPF0146 family protein